MNDLDALLLDAHASGDAAKLVDLYERAADLSKDADRSAFFLTHAHVFALEINHPKTAALRQQLIDQGREAPMPAPNPPLR